MHSVAFYTLGCKVNQYETDAMMGLFESKGYKLVNFNDAADVYVINTCTVTSEGARKSRQVIRRAIKKNPESIVAVVGCYSQIAAKEIEKIKGVDLIVGTKEKHKIVELIERTAKSHRNLLPFVHVKDINNLNVFEEISPYIYKERTRAFVKIQEGCNQYCSYCIIPYARGPIRSRKLKEILKEVKELSNKGFKEIVLTGIHLGIYGKGSNDEKINNKEIGLKNILEELIKIEGIERIRLSSIEPTEVSEEIIYIMKNSGKVCPHLHIPLQSGSREILNKMNRPYNPDQYRKIVSRIREGVKDVAITTDIMVGFPGETQDLFEETLRFVQEIEFSRTHIFKYSPHYGTAAASLPDQVPSKVKDIRSSILENIAKEQEYKFYKGFLGRTLKVLIEQEYNKSDNLMTGYTENYIPVNLSCNHTLQGTIQDVKLKELKEGYVFGVKTS